MPKLRTLRLAYAATCYIAGAAWVMRFLLAEAMRRNGIKLDEMSDADFRLWGDLK